MKTCENCIHLYVCDKQKVTNHKISGSVCKHFKNSSCAVDLSHLMLIEVVRQLGPYEIEEVVLFNQNHLTEEDALRLVNAGEYNNILVIPKKQWVALFQNGKEK